MKKILKNLKEDWVTGKKIKIQMGRDYREIFVNPSRRELKDIMDLANTDVFRFIADKGNQEIYISSADVYHYDMAKEVGLGSDYEIHHLSAKGVWNEGEVKVVEFADALNYDRHLKFNEKYHNRAEELYEEIINGEYDWMESYHFDLEILKKKSEVWLEKVSKESTR